MGKVESFNSVEEIYYFHLAVLVSEFRISIFRWPILKLKRLSICKNAHNSFPVFLAEGIDRVVNFKCYVVRANLPRERFFLVEFLCFWKFNSGWVIVSVFITEELDDIFQCQVAGIFARWHHDDWSSRRSHVSLHPKYLFQQRLLLLSLLHHDISESARMLEDV